MGFTDKTVEGRHIYLVASGAGPGIQARLWMIPGASSFLVGGSFPYATDATDEFLGFKPASYCSREEVLQLAMEAYIRARIHGIQSGEAKKTTGLATTCVVASIASPPRRGDHRIWAASVTPEGAWIEQVVIAKGMGKEARQCDNEFVTNRVEGVLKESGERVSDSELRAIFFKHPFFRYNGTRSDNLNADPIYCGAFNPLHEGHRKVMEQATGSGFINAAYTICVDHPHKPGLSVSDMLDRAARFRIEQKTSRSPVNVLFTEKDPLFIQKFQAFPGRAFMMGVDTFIRMMDPRWGVDPGAILEAATKNHVTVFVSDRLQDGKIVYAWAAIQALVPSGNRRDWQVLEGVHLVDMSSTKLRQAEAA